MRRFQLRLSTIMDLVALAAILLAGVMAWRQWVQQPHRATDRVVTAALDARRASRGTSRVDPAPFLEIAVVVLAAKIVSARRTTSGGASAGRSV